MGIIIDRHLKGKVALITGAAQRLGAMTARFLHAAGANIIIHYRHSQKPALELQQQLQQQRPDSVALVRADLSDSPNLPGLIDESISQWQRLDILINNASTFYPTPIEQATEQQWQDLMASNLKAPYFLSVAAYGALKMHKGCIVNIVDIHSQRPMAGHSIYNMAKAGLEMQVKTLAREMGPDIRVNGVSPGAILWPENGMDDADKKQIIQHTYLKRQGSPEDIARTVLFLVRDADYISGQIIAVDGGRSLYL